MLSRDYIMRIIRTFFDALEKLFDGKKDKSEEEFNRELNELYTAYLKESREELLNRPKEDLPEMWKEDVYALEKCGMLGEIFYREYKLTASPELKQNLRDKAIFLYTYVNEHSSDYSLLYANRVAELERDCPESGED